MSGQVTIHVNLTESDLNKIGFTQELTDRFPFFDCVEIPLKVRWNSADEYCGIVGDNDFVIIRYLESSWTTAQKTSMTCQEFAKLIDCSSWKLADLCVDVNQDYCESAIWNSLHSR